ncbi:biotin/lipoyl-containing protein [Methylocapsa palsarum]|uniref:Biotin-requiring enzyme n=1 Tax=Methylocapsa palsarum TaxID=1612308 RepID=A0A1I4CM26_9HYPH|nr:biotin/lipoyl-containing protein [Methylocapsa palsarum]SFK81710.1 Biotin-requiring enzyme [Methylocapsa palsarum]
MADVKLDEGLWRSGMLPEGVVEKWFVADGAVVSAGDAMAQVRIEGALHDIIAPTGGKVRIVASSNALIEPGSLLAQLID